MTKKNSNINVVIKGTPAAAAAEAAKVIADYVNQKPNGVLGLATGGTPVPVYQELIKKYQAGEVSFSQVTSFNLDEYEGLASDHPHSFRHFMETQLFGSSDFNRSQTHFPSADTDGCVDDYEQSIQAVGGIDLQLLGIGSNGHIAFNEPGSAAESRTRWVDLADETIQANARFFSNETDVPRRAITMGIGTILDAKQILLLATGENKADAIARAICQSPSIQCPASFLQQHDQVTFILDQAAASQL